ncbi:MAG: STAS domain-containing protein [Pseudomonadota bacterium]|nr:STAS domain-containing protein [Pseudomonadota bacterium]
MEISFSKFDQVTVVHLSGKIDFESIKSFRLICARNWNKSRVLFDFEKLNFVGSSGITYLVEAVENLHKLGEAILGFCYLKSEFRRIFEAGPLKDIPIFDNLGNAVKGLMQRNSTVIELPPIENLDPLPLKSVDVN